MKKTYILSNISILLLLSGCASIDFGGKDKGIKYYDPIPYLFVSISDKCVSSATVVSIPGEERIMKFNTGYGASDLSASFANGMLVSVGQKSDSKIPGTLTSIASLATATVVAGEKACKPTATLYPLVNGIPDENNPINFLVSQ